MIMLDLVLNLSGWIIGFISFCIALQEHHAKKKIEKAVEDLKRTGFSNGLKKTLSMILPQIRELRMNEVAQSISQKFLLEYLRATNVEDENILTDVWEKVAFETGNMIQTKVQEQVPSIPKGLAECVTFMFLSHYSKTRAQEYLMTIAKRDKSLQERLGRYYLALSRSPNDCSDLMNLYNACSEEETEAVLISLKGEELTRVAELFASEKWSKRTVERLREYVRVRQMSYNSLASKVLETNPIPRLHILFKNEGIETETEEEEERTRAVRGALLALRRKGKADLIAPLTSVYFMKDPAVVNELLSALPTGEESNYLVFTGAIDPLTVTIKTSDRLEGKPAELYDRLLRFRDYKEFYESIMLKLGVRPSEIIETADLSFLVEPITRELFDALRRRSKTVMDELSRFSGRRISLLTDLRDLDQDDVGYLGTLIAEHCALSQSASRELAVKIVNESKELYDAIYGSV